MELRLAVFASGEGSNLAAMLAAIQRGALQATVAVVLSDRPDCRALQRAEAQGIPSYGVLPSDFPNKAAFETALVTYARHWQADFAVLAGYLRICGPILRSAFAGRMINLHPALLPAFPGLDAVGQALAAGVRVSGCTVHLVDEGIDTGPIIAQQAVPVLQSDDVARLSARIHEAEHRLLPTVLQWFAEDRVHIDGRRVFVEGLP